MLNFFRHSVLSVLCVYDHIANNVLFISLLHTKYLLNWLEHDYSENQLIKIMDVIIGLEYAF